VTTAQVPTTDKSRGDIVKVLFALIATIALGMMGGCNTVEGVGRGQGHWNAVEKAVDENRPK
jgi:predicted small secreted protein